MAALWHSALAPDPWKWEGWPRSGSGSGSSSRSLGPGGMAMFRHLAVAPDPGVREGWLGGRWPGAGSESVCPCARLEGAGGAAGSVEALGRVLGPALGLFPLGWIPPRCSLRALRPHCHPCVFPQTHHTLLLGSGHIGLRNLGNTCFMNAVLQCLSSTRPLRDYCLRKEFQQEPPGGPRAPQELTEAFADVISALWHPDSTEAVNPGRFKAVFQKYVPSFTGYSQQDAQEFLKFFMDRLHVEINRKGRRTPTPAAPRPGHRGQGALMLPVDDERANQMWKRYLEREDSKIVDLFVGQLKSCLKCQACGYRSTTFEVFCDLSLPIPKKGFAGGKVSLHDCFSLFTKEEELDSENAPVCDKCRQRTRSTKKLTIQRFPRILVLRILAGRAGAGRRSWAPCGMGRGLHWERGHGQSSSCSGPDRDVPKSQPTVVTCHCSSPPWGCATWLRSGPSRPLTGAAQTSTGSPPRATPSRNAPCSWTSPCSSST
uniref:ubiquitinyl hydrolase 1 n=1 Tax=Nothoprocta perdicaria TaxID=30464 RepID=A0A8C6YV24_NOTPE